MDTFAWFWPLLMLTLFGITAAEVHPLLAEDEEVPADVDKHNLLISQCRYFKADKYEHKNFTRLCEINDISPTGYIIRLPIYVQGTRDALIQLSTRKNPAPNASVYEFVLGAWGNTRIIIRRKRGYEDMTDVTVDDPLATDQPTKFVIEITTDGHIRVFSEVDKEKPLAVAHDPRPMNVKFMSFAIYEPASAEFFYDCGIQQ